jgi:aminodeoxychorismate lyase
MFLVNGRYADSISVLDRGLHYGDGLFETIAILNGKPLCWEEHYQRLAQGCDRLGLCCPPVDQLYAELRQLPLGPGRNVIKMILTRGQGGRGYQPPAADLPPTRILGLYPWPETSPEYPVTGVKIRICATRLGGNTQLAGIKHLNRLEQILARREWSEPDIAEGLMLDHQDAIVEGTMSNLFCITGSDLFTPELSDCGVAGIIRGCILRLAPALGLKTRIFKFGRTVLAAVDEVFLCNSLIGIWPVRQIEEQGYQPGPWTKKIRQELIRREMIAT